MKNGRSAGFVVLALVLGGSRGALAEDGVEPPVGGAAPAEAPAAAAPAGEKALGLTVELGFQTNYIFRGLNVFGDRQLDANCMFDPSLTYVIPGTTLTVGYWGGFQLNGSNLGAKLATTQGGEQDLWANYDVSLPSDLVLSLGVTAYLYPMSKESTTGASFPVYVEPRVGLSWNGPVVLSVNAMYFLGLQATATIRDGSYFYVTPKVQKTFQFLPVVGLDLWLSYGFKYFLNGNAGLDNLHDVMFRAAVPIRPVGKLYLTPGVGAAWTDFRHRSAAEGFAVYGLFNVGVEL